MIFPEGVAWDGSSQLTNLIWGLTLESRWRSHCLLINGGLTCPRTSISRCTPTTKAPRVETERWCLWMWASQAVRMPKASSARTEGLWELFWEPEMLISPLASAQSLTWNRQRANSWRVASWVSDLAKLSSKFWNPFFCVPLPGHGEDTSKAANAVLSCTSQVQLGTL